MADKPFGEAIGSMMSLCCKELGADRVYVLDTGAGDGRVIAAAERRGERISLSSPGPEESECLRDFWHPAVKDGGVYEDDQRLARPLMDEAGKPLGVIVLYWSQARQLPVTPNQIELVAACARWISGEWVRRAEVRRASDLAEQRHRAMVRGLSEGVFEWDLRSNEVEYSERWKQIVGYGDDEVVHKPDDWFNYVESSDLAQLEADLAMFMAGQTDSLRNQHRLTTITGEKRWVLCRAELVRDEAGEPIRMVGSISDTTEFKAAEAKLRHAAETDKLTGLPNRATLHTRLAQAIRRHKLTGGRRHYAMMFLDFDRFKVINDSLGHDAGDQLLIQIADRLRGQVRSTDTAARIGGDEFIILLEEVEDFDQVKRIADRLLEVFAEPFNIDGNEVTSTASIGIIDGGMGYEDPDAAICDADSAMYHAKSLGKARYAIFDKDMQDQSLKRLVLERELRQAIGTEQIFMAYQPIVTVAEGDVVGFEALVRWKHPEMGVVRPDHFIHVAEETGLIVPLGRWVLEESCRELMLIRQAMPGFEFTMNVNLSKRQLVQPDVVDMLVEVVENAGVDPQWIKLEITESVIMDGQAQVTVVLEEMRRRGFKLAMDDFGTGHSSLSCLHQFPIDVLKIDRSFVSSLDHHVEFAAVIQAIVTLAHTLGLTVVAEGIETMEQLAVLQALDCDSLQGYLFAKPLPLQEVLEFLSAPRSYMNSA
ncbi:putative bifunctional diguanylate cyclase/phosphodiesterase [Algisphaera agarilytica]|uniref:Diguanylate cyclase (GGDEF)-like protein/PAS domain S-box-containing protein n=1 Tax=Algisphaera agarilytica TaxID=1385975 RepID=A0A7X0H4H2_9BACT|nr:GGDEF domain-containing phosphodiesterase [Algisphaera agarilytica]MBB6429049.1 diguanylate cyclase (GGDEF)-like protein/PAS domain S-box-containing protein [Algisphaera agarilytica]